MSNEGSKPTPPDDDYFGIKADHDSAAAGVDSGAAQPSPATNSANSGTVTNTSATTGTAGASLTEDKGSQSPHVRTPKESDSRRGHRDSKRQHKERDSNRHKEGHRDSDRGARSPHNISDRDHHRKKDHHERITPKHLQPPPGTHASVMDDLEEMECYHGNILEDEIKGVLNKHGDYMLRMSADKEGKGIFVTIMWNEEMLNLPVRAKYFDTEGGKEYMYTLDSKTRCLNIKDLIRKHTMMSIPVMRGKTEVWLLNPIAKQSWELRQENVELIKKLGEGAFGEVYSGKLRLPLKKFCNVAVKVIKRSANTEAATMELQKEAAIMRKLKHINIVRFFGMVVKKDTIMVVMELINGGGLDKFLKKFPDTSMEERTGYAAHIACGLAYLHMQGVMHRDIACRNCLLDMYRKVAKVSDFGLARASNEYRLRAEERIPIRWTAPEVVKTYIYTRKADIYAYAILVYEIFSNAALPFDGYTNAQIKDQIHLNEFRPKLPDATPPKVVEWVNRCWHGDPAQRPDLIDVARELNKITPRAVDDDYGGGSGPAGKASKEGNKGTSREKFSRSKKQAKSARSKERGPKPAGAKSREGGFVKSVKSGRTKREGRPSRERAE